MKKIVELYKKYEELTNYIIIGVITTLVSLATYYICTLTFLNVKNACELQVANIISWIVSVAFAFFTNRIYVFKSKSKKILKEFILFYTSRLTTLLIDMLLMFLLVTIMKLNDSIAKLFVQFVIVVLNYIFSKKIVFK